MKIKLEKKELFWALIDPANVEKVLVFLNESSPEASLKEEELPLWAKKQIHLSVKSGKITSDTEILLNEEPTKKVKTTKKKTVKKATEV